MKDLLVIRVVSRLVLPYLLVFAFYLLLQGNISIGGGFVSGILLATGFILYSLVWGVARLNKLFSTQGLLSGISLSLFLVLCAALAPLFFQKPFFTVSSNLEPLLNLLLEAAKGLAICCFLLMLFLGMVNRHAELSEKR